MMGQPMFQFSVGDIDRRFTSPALSSQHGYSCPIKNEIIACQNSPPFGTALQEAWRLLRDHKIKALPVVNRFNRVIGIVTLHDFIKQYDLDVIDGFSDKLRRMLKSTQGIHSEKPEVVGQIMTTAVQTASLEQSILTLVPLFSDSGLHHLPKIGRAHV